MTMTPDEFAEELRDMVRGVEPAPPCMYLEVNEDGKGVELVLDSSRGTYHDWIPGEGGDIGLLRDRETNKVMGVWLPLYKRRLVVRRQKPDGEWETLVSDDDPEYVETE